MIFLTTPSMAPIEGKQLFFNKNQKTFILGDIP